MYTNVYHHSLSGFPGPRLAAATRLYEFYYDSIKVGSYIWEIDRMHKKYGPVVRISPNELHVNEPSFIDTLYAGPHKIRNKHGDFYRGFGIPGAPFATVLHDLHSTRREAVSRLFTIPNLAKLQPVVHSKVEKLCSNMDVFAGSGKPLSLNDAFCCMTTDIVTEFAFGLCWNYLDSKDFGTNLHKAIIAQMRLSLTAKHFPWVAKAVMMLPRWLALHLAPDLEEFVIYENRVTEEVHRVMAMHEKGIQHTDKNYRTIFTELLNSSLPPHEKTAKRLVDEAFVIVDAGTDTTAHVMTVVMFHLLSQPVTLARLQQELRTAIPNSDQIPDWRSLEALPYFNATVTEGLRLSYGASARLPRVAPFETMHLQSSKGPGGPSEWYIPAGTAVGMHNVLIHHDESIFPDSKAFRPERWLDEKGRRHRRLDGYLLTFSKGTRQCLGMNLGYFEAYTCLAAMVLRFSHRMQLFETDASDVEFKHDVFEPVSELSSQGVRVLIK
ncbi:cytochrome P450 [Saccharata proteae CBS 121410]|uniref:Cytochrome P450 n=1 Tax=Saccharata proteae CBS 121410 TaxID=1314787 RepID=A0A9P4I1E9_9PEZI|nr:cytochrome P450 [Saccharata proteae CBS 121410]